MSFTLDFGLKKLLLFRIVYLSDIVYNQKVMPFKYRISSQKNTTHIVNLFTSTKIEVFHFR